ncbi:MAG: hypothetical protein K2W99_06860 [Chthoniobacterales bacterium]|nr:hypothetical protein [Chthoniobacterales bacterium]
MSFLNIDPGKNFDNINRLSEPTLQELTRSSAEFDSKEVEVTSLDNHQQLPISTAADELGSDLWYSWKYGKG